MKNRGIENIPLYSEDRECSSPTCYRIFSAFDKMQAHHLIINGEEIETFYTGMPDTQKLIMSLLGTSEDEFRPK